MCPVETILGYLRDLPGLVDSVAGKAAVDKELTTDVGDISDPTPSREFGLWFRWAGPPVRLVVTGEVSSPRSSGLRRMILLADRESRPEVGTEVGHLVPPVGGIDLAVEATGTTVAELRTRIRERYEPGGAGPRSPRSIVVDGVDDAAAPEELLRDVLKPLADEGVRLLLGFRRTSSPAWALAMRLWPGQDKPDDHPDVLGARVTELTRRINELATREDRLGGYRAHVADRVVIAQRDGKVRQRACELAWRVGPLGGGVSDPDPAVVTRTALAVERAERAVDRACRKVDEAWHALDVSLEELRGLRARLEAYHAMAIDRGRAEDRGLDGAYRRAHAELHRRPADLAVAARLVDAYRAAIEDARS
jgi:hypothetical protein